MSSTLGWNSGSQQPFMRAKHLETDFIIINHHYSSLLIITSSVGRIVFFSNWDSGSNRKNLETTSRVPHEYAAIIRTRTHRQTAHAPYARILGRVAWAGWSGRDLHLPCARLNREIPLSASSPKKANWENRHIYRQSTISSTLGSNSGSQQPFMRTKHFEAVFT